MSGGVILKGGCLDTCAQALAVTFMSLGEKDVSKYLFGPLSTYWLVLLFACSFYFFVD